MLTMRVTITASAASSAQTIWPAIQHVFPSMPTAAPVGTRTAKTQPETTAARQEDHYDQHATHRGKP
jgi:hypothetical protein